MLTDTLDWIRDETLVEHRRALEEYLAWRNHLAGVSRRIVDAIEPDDDYAKSRKVLNGVRDAMNLLAVYAEEYDLPDETVRDLRSRLDGIAHDVAELTA